MLFYYITTFFPPFSPITLKVPRLTFHNQALKRFLAVVDTHNMHHIDCRKLDKVHLEIHFYCCIRCGLIAKSLAILHAHFEANQPEC